MKSKIFLALLTVALVAPSNLAQADDLVLSLDLLNNTAGDAASGGAWELWGRVVDNGGGADGSSGIAGVSTRLDNINDTGIVNEQAAAWDVFESGNASGTTLEVVLGDDLVSPTTGIGIETGANQDTLLASGTWAAGAARPSFTEVAGNFLSGTVGIEPDAASGEVYTLADVNGSNTVSLTDIQPFLNVLNNVDPYNAAADVNQSGTVTLTDIQPFLDVLNGVIAPGSFSASVAAVPEPGTISMLLLGTVSLAGIRRRR